MNTGIVSSDFRGILKDVTLNKENSFKIGEVLKGKVMGFSEGKPILSLKGEIFTATSKVPLRLNQDINVYVQKKEGNTTYLKIVDPEGNDSESKNINALLKNNLNISKLGVLEELVNNSMDMDSALLLLKKGFRLSPSMIDLFSSLGKMKDIKNISDLYKSILGNISDEKKSLFLEKFMPDTSKSESIIKFFKDSLSSFESKLLSEKIEYKENIIDLKSFTAENSKENSETIQKFIDINNILSKDEKNSVFLQIPWHFNKETGNFMFSELSFKSQDIRNKDKVVNIFFVLDMSNTDLLKISSSYFIKGKNIEISFFSENKDVRDLIDNMKEELKLRLENLGLNVWIKTVRPETKKNQSNTILSKPGGIDIKV